MHGWKKHRLIEGGFIVALLAVCVVLTTLQSRWTSNLGRAATRQQASQLRTQANLLCRAFDGQLNDACRQLCPSGEQIATAGRGEAHARGLLRWQAGGPRAMFRRLAAAVPEAGSVRLYLLDQKTARLSPAEWPTEWETLRANLSRRAAGRPAHPFEDPTGFLREYPVFGPPDEPGESEWMILEIDPAYVRQSWLPELVRTYLNPGKEALAGVLVQTRSLPARTIFSNHGEDAPAGTEPVALRFNTKPMGGQLDDGDDASEAFWTLSTWPRSGEFAAAVSDARAHDFALACLLDVCLLIGGLLIVHYARRARRLGEARIQFVATVSHELRTPLTVIRTAGQNLRRGVAHDPQKLDNYGRMIVEHSDRLAEMVEQILSFAGARRNESNLARQPVDVARVVREAIAACAVDTRAAGCEVQAAAGGDPFAVSGDAEALRRVFQNLLTNAAKHGRSGKWIGVRTRRVGGSAPGWVEVEVADRGEGIPARERPHIFEPFFRGRGPVFNEPAAAGSA